MKVLQIDTARFGVLGIDSPVKFTPGLNLWISPNQAGKSTLLNFMEWTLYGPQPQRGQRSTAAIQRWTPWTGGQPSGRIVVQPELKGWPGELLVSARFGDYAIQAVEYRTQKPLADTIEVSKSGEWNLGVHLLNLSRKSFKLSLAALQETLVDPLKGRSLKHMLTSDLGKLVENPDVTTVDRMLELLENPELTLNDGPPLTIRTHRAQVTKEQDILAIERSQLEQRLGEFREVLSERDAAASRLEQQERLAIGLERQASNLELARNYYLQVVTEQLAGDQDTEDSEEPEHPAYEQITPELQLEVGKAASQLELVEQQIRQAQDELRKLEERRQAEEQRQASSRTGSSRLSFERLQRHAQTVEQASSDMQTAQARCEELAVQVPDNVRLRYQEFVKLYEPHRESLSAIAEWHHNRADTDQALAKLRERRAELQIQTRVRLPWTFYVGLMLIGPAVLMPFLGSHFDIFTSAPWIIMGILLIISILLMSPYWRLRRATGTAATELRNEVNPAIEEGTAELTAQDRRRRRFIELYKINRPTWDQLVDNIQEYMQLDLRMRGYNAGCRDLEALKGRLDTAWVGVCEIHPLAPLGVDLGWLREQMAIYGEAPTGADELATLTTRIEDQRQDVRELVAQRDQYQSLLASKLAPVGFADQLKQGLKTALDSFNQVAARVQLRRMSTGQQSALADASRGLLMEREAFQRQWSVLSAGDAERLMQLVSSRDGFETVCTRLQELTAARRDAVAQRDKLRQAFHDTRERLATYGQVDRQAQQLSERDTVVARQHVLVERWDKALQIFKRILESLVDRASQAAAPEIDRALEETIKQAPIPGVKSIKLGPNLSVRLDVEGAPAHIPPDELWTYLSSGAQKQVALALRIAMARTASGRTKLPLLLDEPLEELDDERAAQVFHFIMQLAGTTQVILMTCHERLYNWLLEKYDGVNRLDIKTRTLG